MNRSTRAVGIHQPNFFPWLGYFHKIAAADVFVILDDVQHAKTGGNWSNRVKLLISGQARWVSAPIQRPTHGTALVNQIEWAVQPWREKLLKTLSLEYARAPFRGEAMALLLPLIEHPEPRMAAYNVIAIKAIARALGLATPFVPASEFSLTSASNDRLIALVKAVGGDTYIAGGGGSAYQDDTRFSGAGLKLKYQSFSHPIYAQRGTSVFVPGLSVIDALMNCGLERVRQMVLT